MNWQEIISDFNDGDTWALKYFNNDYDDFFAVLKSKKLFHLLDPLANDSREWQNQYFIWTMENDKQEFYKYMNRILGDVQIDEKGDAYLILDDRKELATLFCDSSRDFSRDTIENILGEDNDWFEYYSETTDDVHRDVVEEIARKFGDLRIQGGMRVEEVEENKRKFQTLSVEEAPVIVLSIQAAKTGHTLTSSEECLFMELPWTPADVDQTYSRLHRIGQKGSVTATYMLTSGTIDEYIYSLIDNKRTVVNAAVEGGEFAEADGAVQLILNLMERASSR